MDENIEYSGIPAGLALVGSIAQAKTYRHQLRDPATGKYARGQGTLKQNYQVHNNPNTGLQILNRQRLRHAMAAWAALTDEQKQTYRDRAKVIRRGHPYPHDNKFWLLGHSLFVSEYEEVNQLLEPQYNSGWVAINQNQVIQLTHNLAGDEEKYVVEMEGRIAADGINHKCYGGTEKAGVWEHGIRWSDLTNTTIDVSRAPNDIHADHVRVRIWIYE